MVVDRTRCPECGGQMTEGRVVDYRRDSARASEWVEGEVQTSIWTGNIKNDTRFEVAAHRCEKCGYLKFYADRPAAPDSIWR
jgi:predicted nucleic-acid-binding Zn-ribbon protein